LQMIHHDPELIENEGGEVAGLADENGVDLLVQQGAPEMMVVRGEVAVAGSRNRREAWSSRKAMRSPLATCAQTRLFLATSTKPTDIRVGRIFSSLVCLIFGLAFMLTSSGCGTVSPSRRRLPALIRAETPNLLLRFGRSARPFNQAGRALLVAEPSPTRQGLSTLVNARLRSALNIRVGNPIYRLPRSPFALSRL